MTDTRTGTRCKVCRHCGACFADEQDGAAKPAFKPHQRCEVCMECGKCLDAWGIILGGGGGEDGVSGATSMASASQLLDTGTNTAPPPAFGPAPGQSAAAAASDAAAALEELESPEYPEPTAARPSYATLKKIDGMDDAATGATPGVASACKDLGFSDLASVSKRLGIKPPGQH